MTEAEQTLLLDAAGLEAHYKVNKRLVRRFGPEIAVYIGNLIDKFRYFRDRGELQEDGAFFLTMDSQVEELGLTKDEIRRCKNKLKELGILRTEMRWVPPKEFYIIDFAKLLEEYTRPGNFNCTEEPMINCTEEPMINHRRNQTVKTNKNKEEQEQRLKTSSGVEKRRNLRRKNHPANSKITPAMFDDFWALYPRKVDKGKAKTKWNQICNRPATSDDRPTWAQIKEAILAQKETDRWRNGYIPHPTTWLNQMRWLDDPAEMNDNWNAASQKETQPETNNAPGPKSILRQQFGKDLGDWVFDHCFMPAKSLFAEQPKITRQGIANKLGEMWSKIDEAQKTHILTMLPNLYQILPSYGPTSLLSAYVKWLVRASENWLTSPSLNMLDIEHSFFQQFCREYAQYQDPYKRHPITGRSFV